MMPAEAEGYLAAALDIIERNALHRDAIYWGAVRAEALQRAVGASTSADTYDAIRWTLSQLQDGHSFFGPPDRGQGAIASGQYDGEATLPHGHLRADRIAYLHVPAFRGSPALATRYADALQHLIAQLDASDPVGWMIDLTDNGGGNMWPMLAGLGPLLGEGPLGAFRFPTQPPTVWSYRSGHALLDDVSLANTTGAGYLLRHPTRPAALLASRRTASSGEAVLIAFVGRPGARRFGTSTRGLTTTNDEFPLPDGATLFLTVGTFADRHGRVYGQALAPDCFCNEPVDHIKACAATWIHEQPSK
ncbi:MAG: hypothetical protein KDG44_07020 [Burkholderiaceae bacterium]|nr:hypothetical protein [Burkholderiaceae bacterium]